jgi:hypothetical protein
MRTALRFAGIALLVSFALPGQAGALDLPAVQGAAGPRALRTVSVPVKLEGSVDVEFTGSPDGCPAPGLRACDVVGSLAWNPGDDAELSAVEISNGGRHELEGALVFFGGLGGPGPVTTTHVTRTAPDGSTGVCSDARTNELVFLDFSAGSASRLDARLLGSEPTDPDLFRTRCGGPLEQDLAALLPVAGINRAKLFKGRATVDLSTIRPFASRGFTGTMRSSIKLRLGRSVVQPPPVPPAPRRRGRNAIRTVTAVYEVERVSGNVVTDFRGGFERSLCDPLGACGAFGSVRVSPSVSSGRATLAAYGNARRASGRALRAALGLRPGPRASGITASGAADWIRDAGTTIATFKNGEGVVCADSAPLGAGYMTFWVGPRRVFTSYGRGTDAGLDPLRTRCPGPSMPDAAQNRPLASGSVPRRAFRRRRVTITLDHGRPFESEPYAGQTRPALTIVLRRVRVRESVDAGSPALALFL